MPVARQTRSQHTRRLAAGFAGALALVLCAGGCTKTLLSPSDRRTPFDSYDLVRDQYAPQYVQNPYGGREPNLRARLSPKR